MQQHYTYQATLAASENIHWRVEDIIGGDRRLDFNRPFMPEALARAEELSFLTPSEQRTLNQIRGNAYLCIFGLVEEFILPFVLDHARPQLASDDYRVRALLQFANEEAKHIHLFKRFKDEFDRGFGSPCQVIGPPEAIARAVLAHDPLAVALAILQIEWMSQSHFIGSIRDDGDLDPQFKSLLRHHWMEEAQHAKLDTLMVEALAEGRDEAGIQSAIDEFLEIGLFLDEGLKTQAGFNLDAFEKATGRALTAAERAELEPQQHQALRWTYLGTGLIHPKFSATVAAISPAARDRLAEVAPIFA